MYRYLLTIIMLLHAIGSPAQPGITGTIQDSAHAPLPYCTIALMDSAASKIIKGTIADDNGQFAIAVPSAGQYIVQVKSTGYIAYTSAIISVDSTLHNMGIVTLNPGAQRLAEVAIKAQRPVIEFKAGTIILNVENDLLANGNTVLELLKRLPGVMVDAQNNVTVDGRGGIGFMMDGRLQQIPTAQLLSMLASMPSESVASIQLIKNPSAKYDAAGTSGLINIISKKVKMRGFSGNVLESLGYGKRGASMSAFSLNYKTNKLTLLTNLNYTNRDALVINTMNRTLATPAGNLMIDASGKSESLISILNLKAGLEYELSDRTTLGINITDGPNTSNEFLQQNTAISGANPFGYNYLSSRAFNPEHYNNPSVNVYAAHTFDTLGTQLKFSADYTNFVDQYAGLNRNRFLLNDVEVLPMLAYNNHIDLNFKVATQKIDFTKMLTNTLMLEAGEKTSFVQNNNNSSVETNIPGTETYHADTSYNNSYEYNEQILAGYVNLTKALTKGSLQLGLRGEQTNIDAINHANGYTLQQHYFNLFPNLSLDYAINQKNSIQATYSYRIDRPSYYQLNPIKGFSDALNYFAGNPQLQPQYSHKINVEMSHGRVFHFSLAYTHTDNSIYNYSFTTSGTQVNVDTIFNYAFSDQLTLGTFAQYQQGKWYSLQAIANFMYGNRKGIINNAQIANETYAVQASMNNLFMLPKNFRIQLNAMYTSAYYDGIQKYGQRASIDIALQKKLLKNKLNATLGIYDILYTANASYTSTLPGQSYYYKQQADTRRLRLTVNYTFGNMKIDRKINNAEDDNTRIKKGK